MIYYGNVTYLRRCNNPEACIIGLNGHYPRSMFIIIMLDSYCSKRDTHYPLLDTQAKYTFKNVKIGRIVLKFIMSVKVTRELYVM